MHNHGHFTYSWLRKRSEIFIFVASHFSTGKHRRHKKKLRSRAWDCPVRGCAGSRAPAGLPGRAGGHFARGARPRFRRPRFARRAARRARSGKKKTPGKGWKRQGKRKKPPQNRSQTNERWKKQKQKPGKLKKKTRCESRLGAEGNRGTRAFRAARCAFRGGRPRSSAGLGLGLGLRAIPSPSAVFVVPRDGIRRP